MGDLVPSTNTIRKQLKAALRVRRTKMSPSIYRAVGLAAHRLKGKTNLELACWFMCQPFEALEAAVRNLAAEEVRDSL